MVQLELNEQELRRTCVEMVSTEACAYRLMDRPAFKRLIAPYEKAFEVKVNSKNAKVWVRDEANHVRELIGNKMFSILPQDTATAS